MGGPRDMALLVLPVGLCRGPGAGQRGREEGVSSPLTASSACQRAECERLLTASAFEDCLDLLPLEPYLQACTQDRCRCPPGASCVCSTIAEFSRQCSHAGGRPGNWRTASLCRKCPRGSGGWGHWRVGWPSVQVGSLGLGCGADPKQGWSPGPFALPSALRLLAIPSSGACLCPFSQDLPWEHGLPGERLALHGHLLAPGGQQPV